MLEIAANNASDSKLVDGTTQHLSSVNDHRVVLSSVDPTTNSTKSSVDLTIGSKCGDEKQMSHCQTVLSTINDARTDDRQFNNVKSMHSDYFGVEEIACGNNDIPALLTEETSLASQKTEELGKFAQLNRMERMSPRRDDQDLIGSKDVKGGCKIGKRRKRVPWSSEYNRRQKNPRRLPRSEMPHDELLRLREKERKAQQLRRERLKRSEELRTKMIKEKVNVVETAKDSSIGASVVDREEGDITLEIEENDIYSPSDRPVYFDGKPLHNCVLKENFMRALGLQQRHKTSDIRSMAEFLVNNIVATGVESNCFNSVTSEDSCFQTRAVGRSICDVGSEKSYQSLSEETSDSSEKKTNPDSLTRKKRRSSLPKEDLERLREKERLAKRRQRAKNKKDFELERSSASNCETSGSLKEASRSSTMHDRGNDSTDTESITDSKSNNDNGESSSCADNTEEAKRIDGTTQDKKEAATKQNDSKKKAFPRYYDRSMLSAEELESLRRREREYQRRRRARLREAKFKATGELSQEERSLKGSRIIGNEGPGIIDDSSKKYETRMANGISCPSLRFLEHSSVFYCENEFSDGKAIIKEEPQPDWKSNDEKSGSDNNPATPIIIEAKRAHSMEGPRESDMSRLELSVDRPYPDRNSGADHPRSMLVAPGGQWKSPPRSFTPSSLSPINDPIHKRPSSACTDVGKQDLPILTDKDVGCDETKSNRGLNICSETPPLPYSGNCATSKVNDLFASDCKILEANGYRCVKADQSYHYYDTERDTGRTFDYAWEPKLRFSPSTPKYLDAQSENLYDSRGFVYDCNEPKEMKKERIETMKMSLNKGGGDTSANNKWRHWKSGLSDSQLQRRRQSNREAQRRRRMRLRLMQMKSLQEQEQVSFEEIMYKRFTPNKRLMVNNAIKAFNMSKSKLKNMLERRQKVFIDAQLEKSRSEPELKSLSCVAEEQRKKGRGCRIKVTPKRQVIVPPMGIPSNMDITEKAESASDDTYFRDLRVNDSCYNSQFDELTSRYFDCNGYDEEESLELEEQMEQTSSRKRKQFCPRRLMTEKERNRREIVPSLVTAL